MVSSCWHSCPGSSDLTQTTSGRKGYPEGPINGDFRIPGACCRPASGLMPLLDLTRKKKGREMVSNLHQHLNFGTGYRPDSTCRASAM